MIKPPSAQWGQCLPSLVWPVSGNAERGSASFLPLSVTSRPFHWRKQDCAHLLSPESNEEWLFKQTEIGLGRTHGSPRSHVKGLLTAPAWAVRCRPEVAVKGAGQSSRVKENQSHAQGASSRPLCASSSLASHQLLSSGRLPPTPGLRHGVPTVGTFLQLPRHQTPPTCIPLISANTALCQWSLFKRYTSHPCVSETHLTFPL